MFEKNHKFSKILILTALMNAQGLCSLPRDVEELINVEKKKGAIATLTCSFDLELKLYFLDSVTFYPGHRVTGAIRKVDKSEGLFDSDPETNEKIQLSGPSYKIIFDNAQVPLPKWPPIPSNLQRLGLPVPGRAVLGTVGLSNLCRSTGEGSILRLSTDDELEAS